MSTLTVETGKIVETAAVAVEEGTDGILALIGTNS